MKSFRGILCCLLLCSPLVYAAKDSPTPLARSLKGKIVFLRSMDLGNMLGFDSQGKPFLSEASGPFAYSAVKIEKVHESRTGLQIKGDRVALAYQTTSESLSLSDIRLIPLKDPVEITIAVDPSSPEAVDNAIEKVFAFSLQSALAGKSPAEEKADLYTIAATAPPDGRPGSSAPASIFQGGIRNVGDGVSPPKLIHAVDPYYPKKIGKKLHIQGYCLLSAVVDKNGIPNHIRISQSLNPVLDMNAILAVSQYRFEPAMYQGKPVPVLIRIQVHYRIY